jgi:prephenate dehydrogenase
MQTVVIVGAGLIGASFGLALRKIGFNGEIVGVSSAPAIAAAISVGAVTGSATLESACRRADLIYLSQTVDRILITLPQLASLAPADALITDAGSTKQTIAAKAAECLERQCFVGGHPLAGKELRGATAADADLFGGRPYVLTPVQGPLSPHIETFRRMLAAMGAKIVEMTPREHDSAVAFTSHLPQLISTTLGATLEAENNPNFAAVHGSGLLDMTRLALSSPELWSGILHENKEQVLSALDRFAKELALARKSVEDDEFQDLFSRGQRLAASIRKE